MAFVGTITCDVCGKQKQAVNHWWMRKIYFMGSKFELLPWDKSLEFNLNFGHICGAECAVKALSEWMTDQAKKG